MNRWVRVVGLLLTPSILMFAQRASGGSHSGGESRAHAGTSQAATFGTPPIVSPRATPSVGLSPSSIGLSPSSIGLSPRSFGTPARGGYPLLSRPQESSYRSVRGRRNNGAYPYAFVGTPYFPFDYGANAYDDYDSGVVEAPPVGPMPSDVSPVDAQLSAQVAQLSAQINDLQNQIGQGAAPPSKGPASNAAPVLPDESTPAPPPVTVVLTSGKRLTVQNYAVIGNTFWDFSSQPARKIAVSQINLAASVQASEAAGAEFPKISAY